MKSKIVNLSLTLTNAQKSLNTNHMRTKKLLLAMELMYPSSICYQFRRRRMEIISKPSICRRVHTVLLWLQFLWNICWHTVGRIMWLCVIVFLVSIYLHWINNAKGYSVFVTWSKGKIISSWAFLASLASQGLIIYY